jgi:protein involved in polysaccharide export with SLBB domain
MSFAPTIPTPETRVWRWPRFGLRTLFEVTFVCGVVFYIWFNRRPDNVIKPDHVLQIEAVGTLVDAPVSGVHLVDPDGYVNLGAVYGKAHVAGMTGDAAEAAILVQLRRFLRDPQVTVSIAGWRDSWELARIQELEAEVQRLKQEALSADRMRQGWHDPQGSPQGEAIPQR